MTKHIYPTTLPTFEGWKNRPVYKAQCKAFRIILDHFNMGRVTESVVHRMHMLKTPKVAPHLPVWDEETTRAHIRMVRIARDRAADIIRHYRLSKRLGLTT